MSRFPRLGADGKSRLQALWQDGECVLCRGCRPGSDGKSRAVPVVLHAAESPASDGRFVHEYKLRDELDGTWAVLPLELVSEGGRTMLVLGDPGGEPLEGLLGAPMDVASFLRIAIVRRQSAGQGPPVRPDPEGSRAWSTPTSSGSTWRIPRIALPKPTTSFSALRDMSASV